MRGMEQQLIIDLKELSQISIECGKCQSQAIINVMSTDARPPQRCPCCNVEFDNRSVRDQISGYIGAYRMLLGVEHKITLRVKPEPFSRVPAV